MKFLVTGATGFIGAALAAELLASGHEVAALVRNATNWRLAEMPRKLRILEGELSDFSPWTEELRAFAPDGVAHLAWAGVGGNERNDPLQVANIAWNADLVVEAAKAGAHVFLGVGSQAEYGPVQGIVAPETPTNPTTLYGEAKLAAGRIAANLAAQNAMRFAWVRVFSTYGGGDHPRWMIPGLIGALLRGERPSLTKGEQRWDFLHVRDAAAAMRMILEDPEAAGVFNLGSGAAPPLRQTIEAVRDLVDPALPLGWGDVPYRPDQVMHLQADTKRLEKIGWEPRVALKDGLADTVAWYRRNQWIYGPR